MTAKARSPSSPKSRKAPVLQPHSKTDDLLATNCVDVAINVMNVKSFEEQEETFALLKILALGNREIEQGKFRYAEDVFAELDNEHHE
ncbi:prevent-host-death protein [Oxalobacteraceae bacterium CAVE-383]|nr:prevent-host-death protein [Oxalobacteraceae bacterium CAVE-383]